MLKNTIARAYAWLLAIFGVVTLVVIGTPSAIADPTVLGVNGTTVNIPLPILDTISGALEVNHGELKHLPGYTVVKVDYPASLGLLTLGGPGYDKSVSIGVQKTVAEIRNAQNGDSSVPVKLACYSQGADVCTQVNDELASTGYDQSSISYLLLGNVDNAEAGIKVRFPYIDEKGVFIPLAGLTLGNATPTTGSDAQITQLLYEYDGFARAPEYPLNLLADLN
ncbi:PE-PPE domain-containing protein, partial [Candidatus Saccharibacteria bacterium]|nr:PE-PPE domain-containing protein [Candidatus Saccharibacteria bacterium]